MKIKATGADPLFILAAIYLASTTSLWWVIVVPIVITSWFFEPRWDSENGWKWFHEEEK